MKFKIPRQVYSGRLSHVFFREVQRQEITVSRLTKAQLRELAEVSRIIEQKGLPDYLVCKKLPGKMGRGLFLHPKAEPIRRGQVIAPYAGELVLVPQIGSENESDYVFCVVSDVMLTREEQSLLGDGRSYHPSRLYSFDLDALTVGNFTRFINHSAEPNVEARLSRLPSRRGKPLEILYVAKKTIHPGQQLLVSYEAEEKSYWGRVKPSPVTPDTFCLKKDLRL